MSPQIELEAKPRRDEKSALAFIGFTAGILVTSLAMNKLAQEPADCVSRNDNTVFDVNLLECSNDLLGTDF